MLPFGFKRVSRMTIMYICMCLKNTHETNCIFTFEKISALNKDRREIYLKTFYIVPVLLLLELMEFITPSKVMYINFKYIFMFK